MCDRNSINQRGLVLLYNDLFPKWKDTFKKANLNILGVHAVPTNGSESSVEYLLDWLKEKKNKDLLGEFENQGIQVEYEIHALPWLLKRSYFEQHPEWFRVDSNGNRNPDLNLCPCSEEALNIIEERSYLLASLLQQNSSRYYFWLDDSADAFCHCEKCKNTSFSDQSLIIMKRILNGIKRYDKNAKLSYLAYKETMEPPKNEIDKDFFLEFAPIDRDMSKSLKEQPDDEFDYLNKLDNLLKVFPSEETQILEYWLDVSMFSKWKRPAVKLPFYPEVVRKDLDIYIEKGCNIVKSFGCYMDENYFNRFGEPPIEEYGKIIQGKY